MWILPTKSRFESFNNKYFKKRENPYVGLNLHETPVFSTLTKDTVSFTGGKKMGRMSKEADYLYKKSVVPLNLEKIFRAKGSKKVKGEKPKSFEESDKKFKPDKYQQEAIQSFKEGNTTVVTAPTGTGKTLIAEYAIEDALKKGKTIVYLSPLKALSNEKFVKFGQLFGNYDENGNLKDTSDIGLITGDTVINPRGHLLVMTTEVYRNALQSEKEGDLKQILEEADGIIYDEFHYLGDSDRGTAWEEAVIHTPKNIKQMMLSATASNAGEIVSWIQKLNPEKDVRLINVPDSERHVPLRHFVYGHSEDYEPVLMQTQKRKISISKILNPDLTSDRQKLALEELENFLKEHNLGETENFLHSITLKQDSMKAETFVTQMVSNGMERQKAEELGLVLSNSCSTTYVGNPRLEYKEDEGLDDLIDIMNKEDMTPALVYIFSKQGCGEAFYNAIKNNGTLLTPEESRAVLDYVNETKEKGIYLGQDFDRFYLKGLLSGYAVHHAGMLPAYKSLVENLAREGLIKVCFATETLIAGINMPFKTTVFTSFEKPSNEGPKTPISNTIFTQGAGRAGRRGKDLIGNVIVMPKSLEDYRENYLALAQGENTELTSSFSLSYASILQDSFLNSTNSSISKTFASYQNPEIAEQIQRNADYMLDYLWDKEYITEENGKLQLLEKGKIARDVYGINEILMTELLSNPEYLKDLTPEELVGAMALFAFPDDKSPCEYFPPKDAKLEQKLTPVIELRNQINEEQSDFLIYKPIPLSTNLVPSIYNFAISPAEKSIETWNKTISDLKTQGNVEYEGDLLRAVNTTIDLIRIIKSATPDKELKEKAQKAIDLLQKSPVTDILSYELAI